MLWTYLKSVYTSIREITFSLAFGTDAVGLVTVGLNTQRIICCQYKENQELLKLYKDLIEERRVNATKILAVY